MRVVDAAVAEVGAGRVAEARETVAVAHSRSVDAARVVLALTAQLLGPAAAASALRRPPRPPRPGLVVDVLLALRHRQAVRHGRRPTDSSDDGRHHQTPHLNRHLFLVHVHTDRQLTIYDKRLSSFVCVIVFPVGIKHDNNNNNNNNN